MSEIKPAWARLNHIALVGTYIPRRCGIATFTSDLVEALKQLDPSRDVGSIALNDRPEGYQYPPDVKFEILEEVKPDYALAADYLNMGRADVVSLQHEFGIYGGTDGRMIADMLRRLRVPVVTTLHTILKDPTEGQRARMREITELSDRLVSLSHLGVEFLRDVYEVPEEKIAMIPHGIHDVPFVDPNFYKDQFHVEGKKVLLTFGLLSPNKGIEAMIDAMPGIVKKNPDAVYMVLGATHPGVREHSGESYREGLIERANKLGVSDHVIFVDKFVETQELMEYLGCADVYITPYLNEAQIVSGTLAYALGAGKATVSTPYWYAQEMLADGRGKLVPFDDIGALADAVNGMFENEIERHAMRKKAYKYTRQMTWSNVATQYMDLFATVQHERSVRPKPHMRRPLRMKLSDIDLKEIDLSHLVQMTDDTGLLQHARFNVPRRIDGYSICDNSRGLIAAVKAADHAAGKKFDVTALAGRYLGFIEHAFNEETGRFRNFMSYDRKWLETEGSEDAHGRTLWSLAVTVSRSSVRGHAMLAADLFREALPATLEFKHPHAWAYSLIGVHDYLRRFSGDSEAKRARDELAVRLYEQWRSNASDDWPWPINEVTYGNGRLVQALLLSGRWTFTDGMVELALRSLQWLFEIQTSVDGNFAPIGCDGWYPRGGKPARFDQQPIEASALISACIEAHSITGDQAWMDKAQWCFRWFLGENDLHQPLYDHRTGGCCDGLTPEGVNHNQGAESTLAWLKSLLELYDHSLETDTDPHLDEQVDEVEAQIDASSTSATS